MPLVRLPRGPSVVDAAFDAFEAKEWTGPLFTHRSQLNKKRRSQGQEAAQDSEPAPPEPPKRQYPKTYGFDDDDLAEGYFKEYSKSLRSKYAYDNKLRAVNNRLSSIYKNYTENQGYLTEAEAFQMKNAHARMYALQKLGRKRGFTLAQ